MIPSAVIKFCDKFSEVSYPDDTAWAKVTIPRLLIKFFCRLIPASGVVTCEILPTMIANAFCVNSHWSKLSVVNCLQFIIIYTRAWAAESPN